MGQLFQITSNGGLDKLIARLKGYQKPNPRVLAILDRYGQEGVNALAAATPSETGETAGLWSYKVISTPTETAIYWMNSHTNEHAHIVILLQYGHGTGTGGYVPGRDFINPALRPIFARCKADVLKEVTSR